MRKREAQASCWRFKWSPADTEQRAPPGRRDRDSILAVDKPPFGFSKRKMDLLEHKQNQTTSTPPQYPNRNSAWPCQSLDKAALDDVFLTSHDFYLEHAELVTPETAVAQGSQQPELETAKVTGTEGLQHPGLIALKAVNSRETGDQQRVTKSCYLQWSEDPENFQYLLAPNGKQGH
ncbi:hypothetical protein H920_09511 [Fukomys damarensis]|uniref:Uncharacterized protein n=1 Tax=Fukomys damarensis TaxID=885580 RepID=A0A091E1W9_FUKDA|nr:hypothetical protein H920_09511 [Fukomys damarensis]